MEPYFLSVLAGKMIVHAALRQDLRRFSKDKGLHSSLFIPTGTVEFISGNFRFRTRSSKNRASSATAIPNYAGGIERFYLPALTERHRVFADRLINFRVKLG